MDSPSLPPETNTRGTLKDTILRPRKLLRLAKLEEMVRALSPAERLALYACTLVLGASSLALVAGANAAVSVVVPSHGGSLTEGLLGPARFINPLTPMSQADADIAGLVYSGLMRPQPDGSAIPDLAGSYEISEDGTSYTFHLREGLTFHDGEPLSASDVVFTVQRAQNPDIKSIHRADWEGVSVSSPDEKTVVFKLPRAYAPFIQNTSMGILPKHLWENVTPEEFPFSPLNTHPIGSGPYKVEDVKTSSTGSVLRYDLRTFSDFALGKPYISRISFVFFPNEEALLKGLNRGDVDAVAGISPEHVDSVTRTDTTVVAKPLPRVFAVFFNQGHNSVFIDASVRAALEMAVEKEGVVARALRGYGIVQSGPLPSDISIAEEGGGAGNIIGYSDASIASARAILEKAGWKYDSEGGWTNAKKQQLAFKLATADTPELAKTGETLVEAWQKLGVRVEVQTYPISELNTNVIRPREYDALLFGQVVGRELDLFAFWHSSQRNDPGLNLALYTNASADSLLLQARTTTNREERQKLYRDFDALVRKERPAMFLYAPEFLYVVPKELSGISLGALTSPSERFLSANLWYTDTEKVWSIFTSDTSITHY